MPTNLCQKAFINWDQADAGGDIQMKFTCQKHTQVTKVLSSGIVSYQNEDDYDGLVEVFGKCYYKESDPDADLYPYMKYFDKVQFEYELLKECYGQQQCQASISYKAFESIPNWKRNNGQFAFAQIACHSNETQLDEKTNWGLLTACISLYLVVIFAFDLSWIGVKIKINSQLVQHELTTVKDFTIQGKIKNGQKYKNDIAGLKRELEESIKDGLQKRGMAPEMTEIVDIKFSFYNKAMLKLLAKRGSALRRAKFDSLRKY